MFAEDEQSAKEGFKEIHHGMKKVTKTVDKNAKKGFKKVHKEAKKDVKTVDREAKKGWKQGGQGRQEGHQGLTFPASPHASTHAWPALFLR